MATESVTYTIELDREEDGRWIAEVLELPGVMAYGVDQTDALRRVKALALHVIADAADAEEAPSQLRFVPAVSIAA